MADYNNSAYYPHAYSGNIYNTAPSFNQTNGINWVQGEAGARSVPIGAGQKVLLMDSENNVFYIKSSDMTGMPLPLRIFEYKEIGQNVDGAQPTQSEYVTKDEFTKAIEDLKKNFKEKKKNEQFTI